MTAAFDAEELETGFRFLDDCPATLVADVVTHPLGSLEQRVAAVAAWRTDLLGGRAPRASDWPGAVGDPIRKALAELGIARFCKDNPDLTDDVLRDVLGALARQHDAFADDVVRELRELETLERKRVADAEAEAQKQDKRSRQARRIEPRTPTDLRQEAERKIAERPRPADQGLMDAWSERVRAWSEIADVFDDLGNLLGRGWDLSQGILKQAGWQDIVRLRKLIEQLPQVRDIVRSLGRLQDTTDATSVAETIFEPVRRLEEERREVKTPHVPADVHGIERSGELARMLPIEAAYLGHPKLRYLWHARRAERALLTYRVEGTEIERVMVERESQVERQKPVPRRDRGPILAVIDTSGSMHGLPERVAKALVLEAMRTAHAEKRRCFVYSYSGPAQINEQELDLSTDGLGRLLAFLGMSFGGGNDETGVMRKVVERIEKADWRKADVVFVSDGEWPAPADLVRMATRARELGTRFHGVQVGNRGTTGLHAICDPVHVFTDWTAVGGWR